MSLLTKISGSWNLGKDIPKLFLAALVGLLFGYILFSKGCTSKTIYSTSVIEKFDSIITVVERPSPPVIIREIRTVVVDSTHDCWGSYYAVFGLDTMSIDSANSCKGIYKGSRLAKGVDSSLVGTLVEFREVLNDTLPFTYKLTPSFGYRVDAQLGASLFGGTLIGVDARVWLDRWGLFVRPRLVIPEVKNSSIDGGVSYRVF